jgi:hypothetical protein
MVSFNVTKTETRTIQAIADRASAMAQSENKSYPRVEAAMDLTATHANGCKLRLEELLAAEPFDFAHDVFGIRRHLNRATGQLEDHFSPRYGVHQ